eukprot:m.265606 g.265606  ORF g.265606 m.265606 type:complete len:585 (+) comp29256_c0_seq1:127-1881(+)
MSNPWKRSPVHVAHLSFADIQRQEQAERDAQIAKQLQEKEQQIAFGTPVLQPEVKSSPDPAPSPLSSKAQEQPVDDDHALALALQAEFDAEYNQRVTEQERKANQYTNSKVSVSLDLWRRPTYLTDPDRHLQQDPDDIESEDESDDEATVYDRTTRTFRDAGGQIVTKHNAKAQAKRNRRKMEQFPVGFASGDMNDFNINNRVFNKLKTYATKSDKRRHREHENKERSTSVLAVDRKTRLQLFRLVNAGILESINGCVSTGKEAVVFHASRYPTALNDEESDNSGTEDAEEDLSATELDVKVAKQDMQQDTQQDTQQAAPSTSTPQDAQELQECAIKVFKTTLTDFKQRQQFLHGDHRFESRVGRQTARKLVKLWATKEMANLKRMHRAGLACPEVIIRRQHLVVMTFVGVDGRPAPHLHEAKLKGSRLQDCYKQCCDAIRTMYTECKLVHCDLSEYNILYHQHKPWFIDVGQAVEISHPRALEWLYRDCEKITTFFNKRGADVLPLKELFKFVCGVTLSDVQEQEFVMKKGAASSRGSKKDDSDDENSSSVCVRFETKISAKTANLLLEPSSDEEEGANLLQG